MKLHKEEKNLLLQTARKSIESMYKDVKPLEVNLEKYSRLKENHGAFVTLTKKGNLRGCIGHIVSQKPLLETVKEVAAHAARKDPRFNPVTKDEVDKLEIEISVLSKPFPIESYVDIEVGKHGLILEEGAFRGVLLPQVPAEHNMDKEQFLSALCNKAGLPANYWREKQLNILMFTADVFSEKEMEKEQ